MDEFSLYHSNMSFKTHQLWVQHEKSKMDVYYLGVQHFFFTTSSIIYIS